MKKYLIGFFVVILLAAAIVINYYYWTTSELDELRYLPPYLLTSFIVYIGIQLLKRYSKKKIQWYDWLYYVGLFSAVLPLITFFTFGDWLFQATRFGAIFFILSPLIELIKMLFFNKTATKDENKGSY
jgi:hypothetical protein